MVTVLNCDWIPASHPYTGRADAAIMAFVDIPIYVRQTLIEKAKNYTYDDTVTITRDQIKGQYDYLPDLRNMHGGSKGTVCVSPSRAKWSDSQKERGMVFCDSGYCIVRPSVCNNWSIIYRTFLFDRATPLAYSYFSAIEPETVGPIGSSATYVPMQILPEGPGDYSSIYYFGEYAVAGAFYSGPGYWSGQSTLVLPAIPEPSVYQLFLLGILFLKVKNVSKRYSTRR